MELGDNDFKAAIINMHNGTKKDMLMINKKIWIFSREMENTKKNQMEIW